MRSVTLFVNSSLIVTCLLSSISTLAQDVLDNSVAKSTASWRAGFDVVLAKPLYSSNPALTSSIQPQPQQFSVEHHEFDFDFTSSPQVWLAVEATEGFGIRTTWWQFASQSNSLSLQPANSGFGRVEHPTFGNVDISAITPTERMSADAELEAYRIDLELTRRVQLGSTDILLSGGLRFASLEQRYLAHLYSHSNALAGAIDFQQHVRGIGPTMALATSRSLTDRWHWDASLRGSLLVGEGEELLHAGEDLDFPNPQRTDTVGYRDQLLPIADIRLGTAYALPEFGVIEPMLRGGWETSWWGDVGNSSGGPSDLGFVGFYLGFEGRY